MYCHVLASATNDLILKCDSQLQPSLQAPGDVQGVIRTLRGLYERCSVAAQGIPGKKREMDDTGK